MAAKQPISSLNGCRTLFQGALAIALVVISYLAFTPLEIPVVSSLNDKFSHIAAFLCLALLVDFSWPHTPWNYIKFLPLMGYGLFIETVQGFLPHRFFSLLDLAADALGLLAYGLILPWLLRQASIKSLR
jgi:VanZ family protein